jgi:hypothetical protein
LQLGVAHQGQEAGLCLLTNGSAVPCRTRTGQVMRASRVGTSTWPPGRGPGTRRLGEAQQQLTGIIGRQRPGTAPLHGHQRPSGPWWPAPGRPGTQAMASHLEPGHAKPVQRPCDGVRERGRRRGDPGAVAGGPATGRPNRFLLVRFGLLPERFGVQLPGVLRSLPSRLRMVTVPKALLQPGCLLVQLLGAAVGGKLTCPRSRSTFPCSCHPVRFVHHRPYPHRSGCPV